MKTLRPATSSGTSSNGTFMKEWDNKKKKQKENKEKNTNVTDIR